MAIAATFEDVQHSYRGDFDKLYNMAVEVAFEESVEVTFEDIHRGDFWILMSDFSGCT